MFGQFTGEEEPDSGLNFPGSNSHPENEKDKICEKFPMYAKKATRRLLNVTKSPSFNWQAHLSKRPLQKILILILFPNKIFSTLITLYRMYFIYFLKFS